MTAPGPTTRFRLLRRTLSIFTAALGLAATASGLAQPAATGAAPTTLPAKAETSLAWGPPGAGLAAALTLEGDVAVGGKLVVRLSLRSAAGQPVDLKTMKDAFGWVLIGQSLGGGKKAFCSEKIRLSAIAADWPAEISGTQAVQSKPVDLSAASAWASDTHRELLLAYVSGKGDEALPKPSGKFNELLSPGRAMAKFTLCLPVAGAKPTLVTSGGLEIIVGPPNLTSFKPEARDAFLKDLLKQFDRDAWSGQQAHDTAARLGKDILPQIIAAAFETNRPAHARLWLATTVADIPDDRSVDALIKLLGDPMGGVRNVVAYHGVKQNSPRMDQALVDRVVSSKDPGLAAWTLTGFMVFRQSVPEEILKAGLESDDPRARAAVAEVLAKHASEYNVSRLVGMLNDKNERVRGTAATMLGKCGADAPHILRALIKALDLPGDSARQRIATALGELTGQKIPYDPKADPAARDKTIADWKAWGAKNSAK